MVSVNQRNLYSARTVLTQVVWVRMGQVAQVGISEPTKFVFSRDRAHPSTTALIIDKKLCVKKCHPEVEDFLSISGLRNWGARQGIALSDIVPYDMAAYDMRANIHVCSRRIYTLCTYNII